MDPMTALVYSYTLVAGLLVGSFLNVCICRIPLGETIVKGRSVCRACRHTIAWYDNIPLLSFLILRGRCRSCGSKISPRYPLVELSNAVLWVWTLSRFGITFHTVLLCLLFSALLTASFLDVDTQIIHDGFSIFIALVGLAALILDPGVTFWERIIGAFVVSLPMLLAACLSNGFGGADIKLSAACGLLLGWQAMLAAAFLALVCGAAYALGLLAARKAGRQTQIPFVPFLSAGIFAAALYGEPLVGWYLSLFI